MSYFSTFGNLTDDQENALLCHYLSRKPANREKTRVLVYKPVIELITALRLKLLQASPLPHFPLEELKNWEEISLQNTVNALNYSGFLESIEFLNNNGNS